MDSQRASDASNISYSITTSRSSQSSFEEEFAYEVLSIEKLVKKMHLYVIEVNKIIDPPMPKSTTMALLDYFKWDKDKLLDRYYDDKDKLFQETKIANPKNTFDVEKSNALKTTNSDIDFLCEICFISSSQMYQTWLEECGHMYCNECWKSYFNAKVIKRIQSIYQNMKALLPKGKTLSRYIFLCLKI